MQDSITNGVGVAVLTRFEQNDSRIGQYLYSYQISIRNYSDAPVKLLSRHWIIVDSMSGRREVEGEGVVGLQPVILPGDAFRYTSACVLESEIGKMSGTYLFENGSDKSLFQVDIPQFVLVFYGKLN